MGITSKAPPLPAPTETETNSPTELTSTEISKPGDEHSSYSIPEDGSPVTIRTRGHRANKSQTSLLIEYFEGGRSGASGSSSERKPSVRVRLTPSKKRQGDHIQVTETKGSRKASLTRRIPLDQALAAREIELNDGEDGNSQTSYASATEESNVSRHPIDIEIDRGHRRRRPASPLIPSTESYQPGNPSEISAIPADSFLDGSGPTADVKRSSSPFLKGETLAAAGAGALAGAAMGELSNNKTRSKDRAIISTDKGKERSDRKRRPKSRTSSVSEQNYEETRSPRRRSGRGQQESTISAADSSVLSSHLSPSHRSMDTQSMRSGASKSSINNPKLLETVEDAIRRLILPELSALKREQSKRESRRGSVTSTGTSISRDDVSVDRRRSSGHRAESSKDSQKSRDRRNREARHDYEDISLRSPSHDSLETDYRDEEYDDATTPRRSGGLLKTAAAGAAGLAAGKMLADAADDRSLSEDRKHRDRRRRRTESARSRSLGREKYDEVYDDDYLTPAPPMPLMSDINPSEMTRTSILSADSDRPISASEEFAPVHETPRGVVMVGGPSADSNPADLQETFSTKHANVSHGDLTALPRGKDKFEEEYETDEFGRKVPIDEYEEGTRHRAPHVDEYPDDDFAERYYSTQDVPAPLKYVPYQAGARGLSPIPSVSGYTEGGSEAPLRRNSRSMHSVSDVYSAEGEQAEYGRDLYSPDSIPSNMRSREFERLSTDERIDHGHEKQAVPGQAVRGVGANPNFVHPPSGVESAVASLVDGSMLDQSVLSGSGPEYAAQMDSNISYDDREAVRSREMSPEKMSIDSRHDLEDEHRATPGSRSHDHSQDVSEYELDDNGRKVRTKYRQSPTASEAAITASAVGAAAAALKAAKERRQQGIQDYAPQGSGVVRNKSFKERTMEGREPRSTPAHSIDRLSFDESNPKIGISAIPDINDPQPEIGYHVEDELQSNPSVVHGRLDGDRGGDLSGRATPTQRSMGYSEDALTPTKSAADETRGLGLTEAAGAAALGAAAGMAAMHSRGPSQDLDEFHRTSDDRKRDTLLTNPYEDASPIVNAALNDNLLPYNYHSGSPGFGQKYDEGYMSNGPNRTPDIEPKGKAVNFSAPTAGMAVEGDPFYVPGDTRHLSGMSQGMASPFYDAATGAGIERIENKDILALMQHLMVRDAQRSARDTEIVALLMNAALEMRTSFKEMKDLLQDTGDDIIFANVENTEKLQKAINGPRPYPGAGSRSIHSASAAGTLDDANAKKKNLWRRALQGLSAKGTSDLSRIEDMLNQLLGEVDVLKTQTAPAGSSGGAGQSYENLQPEGQYEQDRGYEPEGNSTASYASQSGHPSTSQGKTQSLRFGEDRRYSDHRISTVPENEEEYQYDDHPTPSNERTEPGLLSPAQQPEHIRGSSVPLDTPPHTAHASMQPLSAENTPRTEKGRKHKSSSSSGWIPKISRWSETTTSSIGRAFRGSGISKKDPRYEDNLAASRSASSLGSYEDQYHDEAYAEQQPPAAFSDPDLHQMSQPPVVAPIPGPSSYMTPEDPKYKAHRNSLNLQHPQPRPGQTEHFHTLEHSAQEFDTPMTPKSADWAGSATSLNRLPQNSHRMSGASSAAVARDAEYWGASPNQQGAPPRPPKEALDGALATQTPPRSARTSKVHQSSPLSQPGYGSNYSMMASGQAEEYTGSPKLANRNLNAALGVPARRPSGPRAMTPKTLEEEAAREERRRKRDTFGTVGSADTDTF